MVDGLTVLVVMMHINRPQSHGCSAILTGSKSPGGTDTCLTFPHMHFASTIISDVMLPRSFFFAYSWSVVFSYIFLVHSSIPSSMSSMMFPSVSGTSSRNCVCWQIAHPTVILTSLFVPLGISARISLSTCVLVASPQFIQTVSHCVVL